MREQGKNELTPIFLPDFSPDGLFDYQDTMRASYFAFKLLSRLQGERLKLVSFDPAVHGFLTRDQSLRMWNLLVWNFSDKIRDVEIKLTAIPDVRVRHVVLDALSPSSDENARLRPDPPTQWKKGDQRLHIRLEPYAMHYWSLE
jgi:hypothetical protein